MFLHLIRGMTLCYENTTFGTFMQDREDVAGFYGIYTNETYFWMTETINAFQFSQVFIGGVHGDLCETFIDVIIVLGIAKCVSIAMIRDHRLK